LFFSVWCFEFGLNAINLKASTALSEHIDVIPAEAGILSRYSGIESLLDPGFRRGDGMV